MEGILKYFSIIKVQVEFRINAALITNSDQMAKLTQIWVPYN